MNLIQQKQIEDLDTSLEGLQDQITDTGQWLRYLWSGNSTFSGVKTFTGQVYFKTGVQVEGGLEVYNDGLFNRVGVGLPVITGVGFTGRRPNSMLHVSGGNLLVQDGDLTINVGGIYVTGLDGTEAQLKPFWREHNSTLYYSGLAGGDPNGNINIGFEETGHNSDFDEKKVNISGGLQVLEEINVSGLVSGKAEAYFNQVYVTGASGGLTGFRELGAPGSPWWTNQIQFSSGLSGVSVFAGTEDLAYHYTSSDDQYLSTKSGVFDGTLEANFVTGEFVWGTSLSGVYGRFDQLLTISGEPVVTGSVCRPPCGGGGTPGGSDSEVQFNDGGGFGGSPGLIYNSTDNFLSGNSGLFDYLSGSGITIRADLVVGTGAGVAIAVDDSGNVGIGWSGTDDYEGQDYPLQAQLHVSGSTIISGSEIFYVDYDRMPKTDAGFGASDKGRLWIDEAGDNELKVFAG